MSVTFRIKASEAHGRRLDPSFYSPQYKQLDEALASCCYDCYEIRDLRIEVFQGVSRNLLENDRIRLLKVKNILPDGSIDFGDTEPISDVSVNKILKDGDIISPFIGAAIKGYKFGYFEDREGERWTFDNNTGVFRNNDERVLSRYLWSFFQLEITHRQLDRIIGGGGVPYLGAEYAKRLKVILPPLPEQRKIVAELDAAYAAKRAADEKATMLLASIDEMVLKELGIANLPKPDTSLSSRIFTVPAREALNGRLDSYSYSPFFADNLKRIRTNGFWRLGELVTLSHRQWDQKEWKGNASGDFPYIEIGAISVDDGEIGVVERVPIADALSRAKMMVVAGDLLVSLTRPTRRAIAFATDEAIASTGFAVIHGFSDEVMPKYLSVILRSGLCTYQFDQRSTGGNYPAITEEQLLRCEIPIAAKEVQMRIASTASSIRAEARKLKADATAALDAAKRKIEMQVMK
jgi:restriction endonuclease S subunit